MRLTPSPTAFSVLAGCVLGAAAHGAPFLSIGDRAEIFLTAGVGARYESNVFLTPNDTDDTVLTFTPGVELVFGQGALASGSFYLNEEFSRYVDLDDLNDELFSSGFLYRFDNQKLRFSFNASFEEENENTRDVRPTTELIDLVRRDLTRAGASAEWRLTAKTKGALGISYDKTDFDPFFYVDWETINVPANLYYELTPKVDLSAGVSYRTSDLSRIALPGFGEPADTEDLYYSLGARGEFTAKLTGDFSIGYRQRDFDRPVGSTKTSMLGFDARFDYQVTPKLSSNLTLSQDFSTGAFGESLDDLSITIGATAQLAPEWSATGTLTYRDTGYSTARQDEFILARFTGSYAVSEYVRVSAYYTFVTNDSSIYLLNFSNHTLGVVANLRY